MYAVIRAGGKQYRVAPGDVIRVEKLATGEGNLEFELLAVGDNGNVARPQGEARVTGEIMGEGREKKILVFHYKRKKQYKKLNGHRQPFSAVRITEIAYDGQTHQAPALEAQRPKASEGGAAPAKAVKAKKKAGRSPKSSGAAGSASTAPHAGTTKPKRGGK